MTHKPWLNQYDSDVPHTLQPYPRRTLLEVLSENASLRPQHPALLFQGASLSWGALEEASNAFAAALQALGVRKGDRVALMLPNCPQFLISQLGAWKLGAIVVPLNPLYAERELVHALVETGCETVVVLTSAYSRLKQTQRRTPVRHVIATSIKAYLPPVTRLIFTLFMERRGGHRIRLEPGDLWLDDLLRRSEGAFSDTTTRPEDPALLMFTGGTTGQPKAALSTHQALFISGTQIYTWFRRISVPWDDVNLLLMPLFHTYGNIGTFSVAMVARHTMALIPDPRDLNRLIALIRRERPAYLCAVPTLFIALLNHPAVQSGQADLSSLKLCLSGAAPLLAETRKRFMALTGGVILEGYALTESVMATVLTSMDRPAPPGAVGLPLPDVDVRIVDPVEPDRELRPGEVGEILLGAPQLMQCYWRQLEETADVLRNGWLHTGDLGLLDELGYLHVIDRKKDLIKPSGFQVWPREVEEIIAAHPAVVEVGVAGVPDPYQGEAVKAWVVLAEGETLAADDLRAYCRQRLVAYKVPRHIEFRGSLPKSQVGKVLRRVLATEDGRQADGVNGKQRAP